jgi:hypothetical protein
VSGSAIAQSAELEYGDDDDTGAMPEEDIETQTGHEGSAAPVLSGGRVLASWVFSVIAHAILFLVMLLTPWLANIVEEQRPAPVANIQVVGDPEEVSYATFISPELRPESPGSPEADPAIEPRQFDRLSDLTRRPDDDLQIVGIGTGGGDFSQFGLRGGGESGPTFFGAGGAKAQGARRIVYVVDKSGSMTDTFAFVREELHRSITALRRSQKFHVIFFSSGSPVENPPHRPVSAIEAQKREFFSFLAGVTPGGSTHPEQSMRRAFESEPDIIFFLTDGEFDPGLVQKLDGWNRGRRVRIFTIAYFNPHGAELLKTIAREHRGEFRFVTENDLP